MHMYAKHTCANAKITILSVASLRCVHAHQKRIYPEMVYSSPIHMAPRPIIATNSPTNARVPITSSPSHFLTPSQFLGVTLSPSLTPSPLLGMTNPPFHTPSPQPSLSHPIAIVRREQPQSALSQPIAIVRHRRDQPSL